MSMQAPATRPAHVPAALEWPHDIDHFAAELDDPYLAVARLHDGPDIVWAHGIQHGSPGWLLTRYEHIHEALSTPDTFSSVNNTGLSNVLGRRLELNPLEFDPPEHTAYRSVLSPWFTPAAINRLEARVRDIANELLDAIAERGECDFIEDFASKYPSYIFLELMDLPRDRLPDFLEWEDAVFRGATPEIRIGGLRSIVQYFEGYLAELRAAPPANTLASSVAHATISGRPIRDDEALGILTNFFLGGLDTVLSSLGWHYRYLATHPELQARLQQDPSLIPAAVDELMRAFGVTSTTRTVTRDIVFHGVEMKQGDRVLIPTYLASRDARTYDDPHVVKIERKARSVSFATGVHTCLGIHLARRELRVALEEWLRRFSNTRIAAGKKVEWHTEAVFGVDRLPLQFDRVARG